MAVQTRANSQLRQTNNDLAIANAKVTKGNSDLLSASQRERERFDLAMEAIQKYHSGVSEDFLLKQDQFKDLRDRLLRDALEFYRKLEGLLINQPDARSRQALARAYEEVGELTDKIGSMPEALEAYKKALEMRRAMAHEAPSDSAARADAGESLNAIGILLIKTGRNEEALETFEETRLVLGDPVGSDSNRAAILSGIARSRYGTGWAHQRAGKSREALASYEEARVILMKLVGARLDSIDDKRLLSWCYNNIGVLMSQAGKTGKALEAFERARNLKWKIADAHAEVPEFQRDLAMSYNHIGILLLQSSNSLEEALTSHGAALAIQRKLVKTYPAVSDLQMDQANSLTEIGDVLRVQGRNSQARESYEQAIEVLEELSRANPTNIKNQGWLIQSMKGLGATFISEGRITVAVANWRRALEIGERLQSSYGETLYYLAGCHALLGGAARMPGSELSANEGTVELDRAMDSLRRAVAVGYHPVGWIRIDPDLDPLRSRKDFQLLMMDLVFPANPFATTD